MKTHRILALLLALMMLVSLMPTLALADEEAPAEEIPAETAEEIPAEPAEEAPAEEAPVEEAPAEEAAPADEAALPAEDGASEEAAEPETAPVADGTLSGSGYVMMNIPYAAFYAAEGDDTVDAVSSATRTKTRTGTLSGGSYHENADGSDISGVVYPVYVEDLSVLADCRQLTDNDTVTITTTNRGKQSTATYTGVDALYESESYSFYLLTETPAVYKVLTVSGDSFTFGKTTGEKQTVRGITGEVSYYGNHDDVEIALTNTDFTGSEAISGVLLTLDNGAQYGLRHLVNVWRCNELGFNMNECDYGEIIGHTITNITYYTTDCVYSYPVSIAVPGPTDAYVLMNIPYADFYAAEGDSTVDAVTSSTLSKPLSGSLAGGSYHVNADGSDITGVIYPVYVKDVALLENYTQITDEDSVSITVTNRGQTTTTEYTGREALFQSESYSYYVLPASEVPATYKTMTVSRGTVSFSAATAKAQTVEGVTGTVALGGRHTDVEITLAGTTGIDSSTVISGVVLTTSDGAKYGLRHVYNIWRGTQLGFDLDEDCADIVGKTITNIRYYTQTGTIDYPVEITVAECGYVLMNIPYDEFYAAEGDSTVDAVTSSTLNKPRTIGLAGGSYHENADGTDIAGVVFPVFVSDLSVLKDLTQITDESTLSITTKNRGQTATTEFTGADCLFESDTYSYYLLDEIPASYKTLTVAKDGSFSFGAASARASTVEGAEGTVTYSGRHTDIEISLSGVDYDENVYVSGVLLTLEDGSVYGLRHVYNIWRGTELGFSLDESDYGGIIGHTITNIRYYTQTGTVDYPVSIPVMPIPEADGWQCVDGSWYYAEDGVMVADNWVYYEGGWYYMDAEGRMVTDTTYDVDGDVYYFDENGRMATGWQLLGDEEQTDWYYFGSDGRMEADCWVSYGGAWYWMKEDGTMAEDEFISYRGCAYYLKTGGAMATGWLWKDGSFYYFDASGVMVENAWLLYGGRWYYMGDDGVMATGVYDVPGDTTYYFADNGAMNASCWLWKDDSFCWFGSDGRMVKAGWVLYGGSWYYMDENGVMATGLYDVPGDTTYYFGDSGAMATGWLWKDGSFYYFGSDGRMVKNDWLLYGGSWYWLGEDGTMAVGTGVSCVVSGKTVLCDFNTDGRWLRYSTAA